MNRFFIEKIDVNMGQVVLTDFSQLHHLKDVLRVKPGQQVALFDGKGNEYLAQLVEAGVDSAQLKIIGKRPVNDLNVKITVACAIPKKVRMDDIIDKLTQLGVDCIIPLQTERVVVKLDKQKRILRRQRWEKISLSAVKQSQRSNLVVIKPVTEFKDVIAAARDFDLRLIPTLEGERQTLKDILSQYSCGSPGRIMLLIGPEGDFTPQEVALAEQHGFLPISLGEQVLRVDTAAIAAVSFIKLNAQD